MMLLQFSYRIVCWFFLSLALVNMEISAQTLFFTPLNPKTAAQRKKVDVHIPTLSSKGAGVSLKKRYNAKQSCQRAYPIKLLVVCAMSSGAGIKDNEVLSSQYEDLSVKTDASNGNEVKMSIEVSGEKTRTIFDAVFSQMVADAQPIPGFRRVKGGKTPDIPRDILLEVLGPSKVYKQVIKQIINSTVSECVEKEGLAVTKDLRIEQSFEDLEDAFEPGEQFNFDAVLHLQ